MATPKLRNPVAIPTRAPSSTTNGAGMAAALSQFFVYWYNNYTSFIDLDVIMAGGITTAFVWLGAYVTRERRYYMDRKEA